MNNKKKTRMMTVDLPKFLGCRVFLAEGNL